jgi:hypothetical protein
MVSGQDHKAVLRTFSGLGSIIAASKSSIVRSGKMQTNQRYVLPNGRIDRDRAERDMRYQQSQQVRLMVVAMFRAIFRAGSAERNTTREAHRS